MGLSKIMNSRLLVGSRFAHAVNAMGGRIPMNFCMIYPFLLQLTWLTR
jgi:hypothetical protein